MDYKTKQLLAQTYLTNFLSKVCGATRVELVESWQIGINTVFGHAEGILEEICTANEPQITKLVNKTLKLYGINGEIYCDGLWEDINMKHKVHMQFTFYKGKYFECFWDGLRQSPQGRDHKYYPLQMLLLDPVEYFRQYNRDNKRKGNNWPPQDRRIYGPTLQEIIMESLVFRMEQQTVMYSKFCAWRDVVHNVSIPNDMLIYVFDLLRTLVYSK